MEFLKLVFYLIVLAFAIYELKKITIAKKLHRWRTVVMWWYKRVRLMEKTPAAIKSIRIPTVIYAYYTRMVFIDIPYFLI